MLGRPSLLGALVVISFAATAAPAAATVEVHSHNDPAGDPTAIGYHLERPAPLTPVDFTLHDGEYKGFGPFAGTVVIQAVVPTGWQVADIQCTGPNPAEFTIDVPNGRVTMQHGVSEDQICSFTNRKGSASGGGSSGVTPAPSTPGTGPSLVVPRGPALLGAKSGRGFAAATVRPAGVYDVTVSLDPKLRRALRHQGRKRVQLTLRVVVVPQHGLTRVFRYRVLVRL